MTAACHHAPVTSSTGPAVLATYSRSGFIEGSHAGHAVVVGADGEVLRSWGDPAHVIFPRSSNKPAQATAMVESGLDVSSRLLALAASSHSGEDVHLEAVDELLALAGLPTAALQTPADYPYSPTARDAWIRAGRAPESCAMTCSGKHAAMLLTCVLNDWPTDTYRDPAHPLQQAIRSTLERLSGESVGNVGVDGCGAPVMSLSLAGLARMASRVVQGPVGSAERRVGDAMVAYPEMVGGTGREVTTMMRAVPGLVAKDGAEGVYVAALPDGTGIAVKAEDGAERASQVALASVLVSCGVDRAALADVIEVPMLGGGAPVGAVVARIP